MSVPVCSRMPRALAVAAAGRALALACSSDASYDGVLLPRLLPTALLSS